MILEKGEHFMILLKEEADIDLAFESLGAESVNFELFALDARGLYGRVLKLEEVDETGEICLVSVLDRGEQTLKPYMTFLFLKPFNITPVPKNMIHAYKNSRKMYEEKDIKDLDFEMDDFTAKGVQDGE